MALSILFTGSTSHSSCERMYSRTSVDPCITLEDKKDLNGLQSCDMGAFVRVV